MIKKITNSVKWRAFPVVLLLQLLTSALLAQEISISGQVTDEGNVSLPGVSIVVKGTTIGVISDADGRYSINASGNAVLQFSYVGFLTEEIPVNNRSVINVSMVPDISTLKEIVVIGYGSVKKSDLTGSVTSLGEEELNQGVITSVDQLLAGRAPGVQVYQNSSEPGGGLSINIRGVSSINAGNQPLYVIDGLPVDNGPVITGSGDGFTPTRNQRNPLNSLNPNDIESIEILKDASATAIYGARGANGVILVTTKKGKAGEMQVRYDGYYGTQQVVNELDLLSPTEYQTVLNALLDAGAVNATEGERVTEIQNGGTDWQEEIFRSAPVQSHNLSFSGGKDNSHYFVSLNYFNQEGVVISSGIERFTARLNFDNKINDKFHFGLNLNTSVVNDDFVANGVVPNEGSGVISAALDFDPTLSVRDETTGRFSISPFITKDNPLAIAFGKDAEARTFRTFGTLFGEYFILPELSIKLNLGGDVSNTRRDVFVDDQTIDGLPAGGIGTIIVGSRYNYLVEGTVNYKKEFNESHSINAVAGITTQKFFIERLNSSARDFVSLTTTTNNLQSGDPLTFDINSSNIPSTLLSYLGRVNYIYQDKYLLTASFRADGSSKFGENNKFGYFPSFAAGWRLINEDFISSSGIFSDLKLRVGWGQTGNQEIGNFNSLTTFRVPNNTPSSTLVLEDMRFTVTAPSRLANPDLKWETTSQTNVGLDWGFFDGRLSGSIDYFYRKTKDLLLDLPVPPQTGFNTILSNVGSMENQGIELFINSENMVGAFEWSTSFNLAAIKNEVLDLGPIDQIITGSLQFTNQISIITPGEPINSYYGYEVLGVWQTNDDFSEVTDNVNPGDTKFNDLDGNGTLNGDDRKVIGDPIPDLTWGMTNNFSYQGFDLSIYIAGVHGVDLLNNQLADTYFPINFRRNKIAEPYLNRWTPENPSNEFPSFINPNAQGNTPVNTTTVENASYVRIQNVTLGYNFKGKPLGIFKDLHLYLAGNNLHTFTDYSGFDPGANANGNNNAALRIDYNNYPLARSFIVGARFGL